MKSSNKKVTEFLHSQYKVVKEKILNKRDSSQEKIYTDYELIGEGAQKKIYRVYDSRCSRFVAMAVLKGSEESEKNQFLREAKITALLQHPNIMPVYETGLNDDGILYFTMKLSKGESLKDYLKNNTALSLQDKLNIFIRVCDGLIYAHSKGIIHRDIKPDNIYIGQFGEVLLCDWGLANIVYADCDEEILDDETIAELDLKVSLKGQIKGTPGYIAPEIISSTEYSFQSDIFALGAVLHFMLTNEVPVQGKSSNEILKNTENGQLCLFPGEANSLSAGLKAICRKSLEIEKTERYQKVDELIADLKKYLEGFAPQAEEASAWTQLKLFYKRNQTVCNLILFFVLSLVAVTTLFISSIKQKEQKAVTLLNQLKESDTIRKKMESDLIPVYLNKAKNAFLNGDPETALALAEVTYNFDNQRNDTKDIFGKSLMSMQLFSEAASILDGVNDELYEIAVKFADIKTGEKLDLDQIILFLKAVGVEPENDRAYIYRNILYEEFKKVSPQSKLKLLEAVLKMRNNLSELNCELRYEDDAYILDLANNPGLKILNVLQKFGPAVVKKFDLSNNTIKNIYPIENLNILELHFRNTGPFPLKYLTHYYEYLDAEGSKNDFSPFLENKPVKYLNIHNSLFTNYKVLTTLKNLETLIVSKGKLTEKIRSKLPKNCKVVEK